MKEGDVLTFKTYIYNGFKLKLNGWYFFNKHSAWTVCKIERIEENINDVLFFGLFDFKTEEDLTCYVKDLKKNQIVFKKFSIKNIVKLLFKKL